MNAKKITPEAIAELDTLYTQNGILREEDVVAHSKRKTSALHEIFLWDDDREAARIGRMEIARRLIMRVTIRYEPRDEKGVSIRVRKYHGTGEGYVSVRDLEGDAEKMERVLRMAVRELRALRDKYNHLKELSGVFEAIDSVEVS